MTDAFKGYVTVAGLSPPIARNGADLIGIAGGKSFEQGRNRLADPR
jgi:hypothetical protein